MKSDYKTNVLKFGNFDERLDLGTVISNLQYLQNSGINFFN